MAENEGIPQFMAIFTSGSFAEQHVGYKLACEVLIIDPLVNIQKDMENHNF